MFQQTYSGLTTLCDKVCQWFAAGQWFSPTVYCQSGPPREILHGGPRLVWGPGEQTETSLKIEDLRSNKTTGSLPDYKINVADDQQPEFRCLWEFYIFIFLNKLKICLWLRLWGSSEIHKPLLCSTGPGLMYRLNPSLIGPVVSLNKLTTNNQLVWRQARTNVPTKLLPLS